MGDRCPSGSNAVPGGLLLARAAASTLSPVGIDLFPGFAAETLQPAGVPLFLRRGGQGPALLLLHGHPQTHAMWHRVASRLSERFSLVVPDLRGYGRSARVAAAGGGSDPAAYARREQAAELHALMQSLGHTRYGVLAHDRGARTAHRLALEQPHAVQRLMLLDVAPTRAMYEHTSEAFARAYWHWFFLIQPPPLPERLIEADPAAYLRDVMGRRHAGLAAFDAAAWADYENGISRPGSAQAICDDYRAAAGIDLEHDRESEALGQRVTQPLAVRWAEHGAVGRCYDVPALWRAAVASAGLLDAHAMPCGHYIAEEQPDALLADAIPFFSALET